jgi:hypothetical protein
VSVPTFHIAVPAWGEHYVDLAIRFTVPAIIAALDAVDFDLRCRFHVFTDRRDAFRALLAQEEVHWHPAPPNKGHPGLTMAHRETLRQAAEGSIAVLLNADIVVSREAFSVAAALLGAGRTRVLASTGVRSVLKDDELPPVGGGAASVFAWAWRHRHPFMEDSVWGRGRTAWPTTLFFESEGTVVARCFHLHPFFVLKDRPLQFKGTVDDDLVARYRPDEIRVLGEREIGFAEISPASRQFGVGAPLTEAYVIKFGKNFIPAHVRNFSYPIRICGDGPVDDAAWETIAAGLGWKAAA